MPGSPLGRTLVIANPTAHSGRGEDGARFAQEFLQSYASATRGFEVVRTQGPADATRIARGARGFDTILALGGDGVIHEVVCGLMALPREARPQLGVIPLGSGNDYARTLGMARNDVEAALAQLVRGRARHVEVGRVNGTPFMQTLSFGLDAAIALDTTNRRAAGTSQEGEALFVTSALRILSNAREGFPLRASFDGEKTQDLSTIIFAVQVGPSYGGGFKICPNADPTDGLLDVCYNVKLPALPRLMALLGLARLGRHTGSSVVRLRRCRSLTLDFERETPCQADGEKVCGTHFDVSVVPDALDVIFPS